MCNKIVGELACPICGNVDATIHVHAKGKSKFYLRCYEGKGGSKMICGTLQAMGPKAQEIFTSKGKFYQGETPEEKPVQDAIAFKPVVKQSDNAIASPEKQQEPVQTPPPPTESSALMRFFIG